MNAVRQQPAMKTCNTHLVVAFVALLGPAAAWAGEAMTPSNALLLLAATDGVAADAAAESERMHQRIRLRRQSQGQPAVVPYGTGYEARKELSGPGVDAVVGDERTERAERPERVDRPERIERVERPERVDRPDFGGAGRGGR